MTARSGGAPVRPALRVGEAVASPCINVCRMNERSGLCDGCWRTIDEIALWSQLDNEVKREVLRLVAQRREAAR